MTKEELFKRLKKRKLNILAKKIEWEREMEVLLSTSAVEVHGQVKACKDLHSLLFYFAEYEETDLFELTDMILEVI